MPRPRLPSVRASARFISVDLQNVRLSLGGKPVLRGIDWHIRPGQRWVLIGPNGAGKTQLLKLLAGDVWPNPASGQVRRYRRPLEGHQPVRIAAEQDGQHQDRAAAEHRSHYRIGGVPAGDELAADQ